MKVLPFQKIQMEKFERQKKIKELEFHSNGHCVHLGKISPGCRRCYTKEQGSGVQIGSQCMYRCDYCYYDRDRKEHTDQYLNKLLADFFEKSLDPEWNPTIFAYQSYGETLYYIDWMEKFSLLLEQTARRSGINQYTFLYTNGVLADRQMLERVKNCNVNEVRFHLGASNFSNKVINNMRTAKEMGFFVTVETPSYPLHREQIFDILPTLNEIGIKHLDLVEVQITPFNLPDLERNYPGDKGVAYKDNFYHLYDHGLVYDVIEKVVEEGHDFSVLDCNSAVERCRHTQDYAAMFDWEVVRGMCSDWDYGKPELNW